MSERENKASAVALRALDILWLQNPRGTSLGVCAGTFVASLIHSATGPVYLGAFDLTRIGTWAYLAAGVFAFNFHTLWHRRALPPKVEDAFAAIATLERDKKITVAQARLERLALLNGLVEQVKQQPPTTSGSGSLKTAG
jgi:hypothetical protein